MSSRTPNGSERRLPGAVAALLLALLSVPWLGPRPASAAAPLPVAAVLTGGAQTTLVVDLSASTRAGRRTVAVTLGGRAQRADLVPVMADGLTVALVVDASSEGAGTLPAWLSAAARFILEAPGTTRAVVIADRGPAAALTPPLRGPTGVVQALTSVTAGGDRDTGAALALAARQFPQAPAGRRVIVMYTTAADAGGEEAAALATRLREAGTILVVVGTAGDAYWSGAAAATGGFFSPAGRPVVVPALDQVESTLQGRYLIRFPTPPALPARVSIRVETGDVTLTAETVVPSPARAADPRGSRTRTIVGSLVGAAVVASAAALALLVYGRSRRPRAKPEPPGLTAVFRGRATVPHGVARGRAAVPADPGDPPTRTG